MGLYTQCAWRTPRCASQRKVALLAERIRPMTVSSPFRHTSSRSSESGPSLFVGVIVRPGKGPSPVAVGAHTDVALRVERLIAQRAGRPARGDHPVGARRELTGGLRRQ